MGIRIAACRCAPLSRSRNRGCLRFFEQMLLRRGRVELALPTGDTVIGRATPELLLGGEKRISRTQLRLAPTDDGRLLAECLGVNNSAYKLHDDVAEQPLPTGATVTLSV